MYDVHKICFTYSLIDVASAKHVRICKLRGTMELIFKEEASTSFCCFDIKEIFIYYIKTAKISKCI